MNYFVGFNEAQESDSQTIVTTGEHPFFVVGRGWVKAFDLSPGDQLETEDGQTVEIQSTEATGKLESVYNIRVAHDHTYFVGSPDWGFAIWVHNDYHIVKSTVMGESKYRVRDQKGNVTRNPTTNKKESFDSLEDAQQRLKEINRINNITDVAPPQVWETINGFRTFKKSMNATDDLLVKGDLQGTVAYVELGEKKVFGVNSKALDPIRKEKELGLAAEWAAKLGSKVDKQFLYHAEAHALMRLFKKNSGSLPSELSMYVDRVTCSFCKTDLGKLASEMALRILKSMKKVDEWAVL